MARHYLVETGVISAATCDKAEAQRARLGGTLGQHLIRMGVIDEMVLARTFAQRLAVPLLGIEDLSAIAAATLAQLSAEVAVEHRAIPVRLEADELLVALADPTDDRALEEVTFFAGAYIRRAVAPESAIDWALARYYGHRPGQAWLPEPASGEVGELFAGKREPSQLILLTRRKGAGSQEAPEPDTLPLRMPRHDTQEEPVSDSTWTPPSEVEIAPTVRMPSLKKTVEMPGLPASLLAEQAGELHARDDDRTTDESPQAPGAVPDLDPSAADELPTIAIPRRPAGDAIPKPPTDEIEHRPTTAYKAVASARETEESPAPQRRRANDTDQTVSVGQKRFTARHGAAERNSDNAGRPRRQTMTGIAPASQGHTSDGDPTGETTILDPHRRRAARPYRRRTQRDLPRASHQLELETVVDRMSKAGTEAELGDLALEFLGRFCDRRALLYIDDAGISGWAAAGGTLRTDSIRSLWIPLERSSVFGAVIQSMIPYQGPLLYGKEERVFASHIGRHPTQIMLVPVVADDEVIALIYGDGLAANLSLSLVRTMAQALASARVRLARRS